MISAGVIPIRLAVFDVAGTTVLDGDAVVETLCEALADHHVKVPRADAVAVMGWPKPNAIRYLLSTHGGIDASALDTTVTFVHKRFRAAIIERYRTDDSVVAADGAVHVFEKLHQAGAQVALDTGFSRDILDVLLDRLGWKNSGDVDVTVASDEVERGRPFPDLIHRAMELASVGDPQLVAKIGDTPSDLEQGRAAGCGLVVGVTYGTHSRSQLERPDVHVIDHLPDLLPLVGLTTP